ncbi:MAG: Protein TolB [Anaerolineae bacterium]|nr:Protein TolB [Anaerolineae bacterium]
MSEENRAVTQVGPAMAPKLQVTRGENAGEEFKVKMRTRLGRERDNDIILLDLKSSRHHAEIEVKEGDWVLTDLASANGTFLNGAPVKAPLPIKHGDIITVGETDLVFKIPGKPEPAVTTSGSMGPPQPVEVPRRGEASGAFPAVSRPPQPAPQKSNRLVWIIGGAAVVLCLVAALVVVFAMNRFSGGSSATNGEQTPTAQAAAPGDSVKPPLPGNQSVEVPGRPTDLALVYEEDFSDSFSGWDDAFDAYTRKVYGNNRYNIEVFASNLVAWGLANRIVSDFEIEVEGKLEDGDNTNSYGLLFRFKDRENFYRFDISGDGYYLFSKFVDGEWITLVDWTPSEFINTGLGATNILKVTAFGPNISLSVNGQQLAAVTDDSLTRGNFGFFSGTFAESYSWVSFDNLKMWTQPNEEIVLIPTATPIGSGSVAAAPTPTVTPLPPTATAVEQASEKASPEATPTASPSPVPSPTATPVPLPEYASREQTLARGEQVASGRVIFPVYDTTRGVYDIYMADISNGDNLLLIQKNASQPALTSNGKEIAYRSWQLDKRGLFARQLAGDPTNAWGFDLFFESARPQYSPDDKTLMYFSRTGGKEPAIYQVIDGVGEVKRRDGAPIQGKSPKWSPDGSQFVYNGCLGGKCGIILSNVDGNAPVLLTDQPADTNPEISPDGSTVVFMSDRAGNWEVYSIDITGENLQALTSDSSSDGLPTWSPDGSKIAFVSNRDNEWAMWVMNPDGSNKRRQFVIDGEMDGIIQSDIANSYGWSEENIDWVP